LTKPELDWFYGGGAGRFWPDLWDRFTKIIPKDEHGDFIAAYHKRLFSGDHGIETRYARALNRMNSIAKIPGVIVQGRFDMICPPISAYKLSQKWPASNLTFVGKAGHALSEPGISAELVRTMDCFTAQRDSLRF